jgi:hypothetical protein
LLADIRALSPNPDSNHGSSNAKSVIKKEIESKISVVAGLKLGSKIQGETRPSRQGAAETNETVSDVASRCRNKTEQESSQNINNKDSDGESIAAFEIGNNEIATHSAKRCANEEKIKSHGRCFGWINARIIRLMITVPKKYPKAVTGL